jgi:hypothetical protein
MFHRVFELQSPFKQPKRFTFVPGSKACDSCTLNRAILEPESGAIFGFHLPWTMETTPAHVVSTLKGLKPSIYNTFYTFDATQSPPIDIKLLFWHASLIAGVGGNPVFQITIEALGNSSAIPDSVIDEFASYVQLVNTRWGLPVLLRWGHEMNGIWTDYGMLYIILGFTF